MRYVEGGTFLIPRENWIPPSLLINCFLELASFSLSFCLILKVKPNNNAFRLYQVIWTKWFSCRKVLFYCTVLIHWLKENCPEKYVRRKPKYGWGRKIKFLKKTSDILLTMIVMLFLGLFFFFFFFPPSGREGQYA